jgi:hypothetical protein
LDLIYLFHSEEALAMYKKVDNLWAAIFVDKSRELARAGLAQRSYTGGPPTAIPETEGGGPWFLTWWGLATRDRFVSASSTLVVANEKWNPSNFAFDWQKEEACRPSGRDEDPRCGASL